MIANFSIGSSIIANQNLLSPSIDIDFNKNTTEYNATWYQRQWLKNSDFSSMEGWNYSIVGDTSDVEFVYENNAPGMKVVGDSGNFSLVSAPPLAANWTAFLSAVLNVDQKNFMVIVGIDIMCEDSFATDADLFDMLRIKSISLNFTYEKQINQGTYLELKQEGDRLSGANTYIQSARMWYKYKADDDWVASSPNSEYRVLINGIPHTEIKRFSQANTSFQDINEDGMDVTKIVLKEQNILVAIQFYLADLFYLDKNITLYVTDLQLEIVWVEVVFNPPPPPPQVPEPGPDYTPVIRGLLATIAGMITLAIVYQLHWKYPPKIRKLRAIRRKLNSGKPIKTIAQSKSRDALVEEIQVKELKKNKIVKKPRAIESEQIKPELDKKASVDLLQNGLPDVSNKAIGLNIGDKAEELKKETDLSPLPDKPKMDEHVEG